MHRSIMPSHSRRGFLKYVAIGCLALIVLVGIAGFIAFRNIHKLAAAAVESGFTALIESSPMPAVQKADLMEQVKALAQEVRDKKIGMEEFSKIMQEFSESPLLSLGMIGMAETKYFEGTTFTDEQKADAQLAFDRFLRGVVEEKIKSDQIKRVTDMVFTEKPNGQNELKTLTDEERQTLLATVKEIADEAAIPSEAFEPDFSKEFKKVIDRGLGRETVDETEDYDGGTTATMNSDRPADVGKESLDLDVPKDIPAETPAQ